MSRQEEESWAKISEARVNTIEEVSEIFISEMEESCDAVRAPMICNIARRLDYDPEKLLEMALSIKMTGLSKHYRSINKRELRIHNENQKPVYGHPGD